MVGLRMNYNETVAAMTFTALLGGVQEKKETRNFHLKET
jgi:hypothetical protein